MTATRSAGDNAPYADTVLAMHGREQDRLVDSQKGVASFLKRNSHSE